MPYFIQKKIAGISFKFSWHSPVTYLDQDSSSLPGQVHTDNPLPGAGDQWQTSSRKPENTFSNEFVVGIHDG